MGIEPTFAAWEAAVLPMNYIRVAALPEFHRGTAPRTASVFLRATLIKVGEYYVRHPRRWWAKPELNRETGRNGKACSRGRLVRVRDRTIFAHAVWSWRLPFGRPTAAVREGR